MKTEYIPEPPRDQQEPRWWQTINTGAFLIKVRSMQRDEIESLSTEISGALAVIQSQLESRGKTNPGWWSSARAAMGFMIEKQHLVRGELQRLNRLTRAARVDDKKGDERRKISMIREKHLLEIRELAQTDTTATIVALVDWMLNRKDSP